MLCTVESNETIVFSIISIRCIALEPILNEFKSLLRSDWAEIRFIDPRFYYSLLLTFVLIINSCLYKASSAYLCRFFFSPYVISVSSLLGSLFFKGDDTPWWSGIVFTCLQREVGDWFLPFDYGLVNLDIAELRGFFAAIWYPVSLYSLTKPGEFNEF